MTNLLFLAAVLAVYACSLMVSKLSGPGRIFARIRRKATGATKEGLSCPICTGTWFAIACVAFCCWQRGIPWIEAPLWTFAVAGGNALLHLFDPI